MWVTHFMNYLVRELGNILAGSCCDIELHVKNATFYAHTLLPTFSEMDMFITIRYSCAFREN